MIDRDTVTNWLCEHGVDNTMTLAECITAAQFVAQKAVEGERERCQRIAHDEYTMRKQESEKYSQELKLQALSGIQAASSIYHAIRKRGIGGGE